MPADLVTDIPGFIYFYNGQYVARRLRVWDDHRGECFAVITEEGLGVSITNAAEAVVPRVEKFVHENIDLDAKVHVIEHYPQGGGFEGEEHYDLVWLDGGRPKWRRLTTEVQEEFLVGLR